MDSPLVSIIIPVYNVEKYIHTCIESVIHQTYSSWELILINDGSPDNCPAICEEYAARDKRVKVIHKENGGVASARNMGINIAKGSYISFLDSDDFWHPNYLENMLILAVKQNADIVQCDFLRGTKNHFPKKILTFKNFILDNREVFIKGFANIIVCAKLYKIEICKNILITENKKFEDDFTTWKWYFSAEKIVYSDQNLYYYTENNSSTMSQYKTKPNLDFMEAYDERISFFRDNDEKAMEDFSRIHYCKALLLTSANKMLTNEQKKLVRDTFVENYNVIKYSKIARSPFLILFAMFRFFPKITLLLLNTVRK